VDGGSRDRAMRNTRCLVAAALAGGGDVREAAAERAGRPTGLTEETGWRPCRGVGDDGGGDGEQPRAPQHCVARLK
jgi:hypothetical protein